MERQKGRTQKKKISLELSTQRERKTPQVAHAFLVPLSRNGTWIYFPTRRCSNAKRSEAGSEAGRRGGTGGGGSRHHFIYLPSTYHHHHITTITTLKNTPPKRKRKKLHTHARAHMAQPMPFDHAKNLHMSPCLPPGVLSYWGKSHTRTCRALVWDA